MTKLSKLSTGSVFPRGKKDSLKSSFSNNKTSYSSNHFNCTQAFRYVFVANITLEFKYCLHVIVCVYKLTLSPLSLLEFAERKLHSSLLTDSLLL